MEYWKLWNVDLDDFSTPMDDCITCPVCGFQYVHFEPPTFTGSDNYTAWKGGRGSAVKIPMWCENGHAWTLGFGFHKGNTMMFWERDTVAEALEAEQQAGQDG